jgi:DNA repair photolyase
LLALLEEKLSEFDYNIETPSIRQRRAAIKAWTTMRRNKNRLVSAQLVKIDSYLSLKDLSSIKHPELLTPSHQQGILSIGKGIISLFHKTPPDIACGRFWELRWAFGCPLDCNYCYLRGTMKGRMKPSPIKIHYILSAIDEAFQTIKEPSIFNTGELSDSLMYPSIMEKIVDKFEEQDKHKIGLLSKMGTRNIDFLLGKLRKQTICAWSINSMEAARRWETSAPSPEERIEAAKLVAKMGYDTRIRIDPIFPIENWKNDYARVVDFIFSHFEPKRIILGTPRGLWKTIVFAQKAKVDMSWTKFFKEDSSWGKKLDFNLRREIYEFFYDKLHSMGYPTSRITMCKETTSMWKALALDYKSLTCNCYGREAM